MAGTGFLSGTIQNCVHIVSAMPPPLGALPPPMRLRWGAARELLGGEKIVLRATRRASPLTPGPPACSNQIRLHDAQI